MSKSYPKLLAIFILVSLALASTQSTLDPLFISKVSSFDEFDNSEVSTGLLGSSRIRIEGSGFDPIPANNIVTIGSSPCTVIKMSYDTIICNTGFSSQLYRPTVTISAPGKQKYSCSSCYISFNYTRTPILQRVYPRSGPVNSRTFFIGKYRFGPQSKLTPTNFGIWIGDTICSAGTITQSTSQESVTHLLCDTAKKEAGRQTVDAYNSLGFAIKAPSMTSTSVYALKPLENFEYLVVPTVQSLSSHQGSPQGNFLTITGTGFSEDSVVSVTAADLPCGFPKITGNQIRCEVYHDIDGVNGGKMSTNSTAQKEGFTKGSGFVHEVYDITECPANFQSVDIDTFRNLYATKSNKIVKLPETNFSTRSVFGELEMTNADYNDLKSHYTGVKCFGSVTRGYFKSPTFETYKFSLLALKNASVYKSKVKGSAEIDYTAAFLKFTTTKQFTQNEAEVERIRQITDPSMTVNVDMERFQTVYFEIFSTSDQSSALEHMPIWSFNFQTTTLDIFSAIPDPAAVPAALNKIQEIQKIEMAVTYDPQTLVFEHVGATSGNFQYSEGTSSTNKKTVPYNANTQQFRDVLRSYDHIEKYFDSLTVEIFDFNSVLTSTSQNPAYKYRYTVKLKGVFDAARPINVKNLNAVNTVNVTTIPTGTVTVGTPPSTPLGGTFGLSFRGKVLKSDPSQAAAYAFGTDGTDEMMERIMYNLFGIFVKATVAVENYRRTLYVEFKGQVGDIPPFVISTSALTGGKVGSTPTVVVTTLRDSSNLLRFEPISDEFLTAPSDKSSVKIYMNNVASQCKGDCSYVISNTGLPTIQTATLATNVLTLVLDSTLPTPFDVTLGGQTCTFDSGTYTNYKCHLPADSTGYPVIQFGSYKPKLTVGSKGFAIVNPAVTAIAIPLSIDSVTPGSATRYGGTLLKIKGKGFPINAQQIFKLKVCDLDVIPISVSNNEIQFMSLPCESLSTTIELKIEQQSATIPLTVTDTFATNVHDIAPKSASPLERSIIGLAGTGLGTDKTKLKVWLTQNNINVFELKIVSLDASGQMRLVLPRGVVGQYNLRLFKEGEGYASTLDAGSADISKFTFGIFVSSVSPTIGSKFGGTVITISGQHFSAVPEDNDVYIGQLASSKCEVLTATDTQITCRSPPMSASYANPQQTVYVIVQKKVQATCTGTCTFAYDTATSPTITNGQSESQILSGYSGDSLTLAGTGLEKASVKPKVFIGGKEATIVTASATSVNFLMPELYAGQYPVNVFVDATGYASNSVFINSVFRLGSTVATFSTEGNSLTIGGSGFLPMNDENLKISTNNSALSYKVTDVTPTQIKMDVGKCNAGDTTQFSIAVLGSTKTFNYPCTAASTPVVVLKSTTQGMYNAATQPISFNQTTATVTGPPSTAYAYLVDSDNKRFGQDISLPISSSSGSEFILSGVLLASGRYKFKFLYAGKGLAKCDSTFEIIESSVPTIASFDSGYFGGHEILVAGLGLNKQSKVTIGGRIEAEIDLTRSSSTALYYTTPTYLNRLTEDQFGLSKDIKLTGDIMADDLLSAPNAFDNKLTTVYSLYQTSTYLGLDFGPTKRAVISKVKYFTNSFGYIADFELRCSNDNVTWVSFGETEAQTTQGWNVFLPVITPEIWFTSYRYVQIKGVKLPLDVSEVQFWGFFVSEPLTSLASNIISVDFSDGIHTHKNISQITYKSISSPTVTALSARFGKPAGAETLTITGTNFGTVIGDVKVLIDAIPCVVTAVTAVQIVCTTGTRPSLPSSNTFSVSVKDNQALIKTDPFLYAYRWTQEITWGEDFTPMDGDTIYVPPGMVLIVDKSTANLAQILVEGTIIFDSAQPLFVTAEYIHISQGKFLVGTVHQPYQNQLTITLTGTPNSKQRSLFGNKVIGCAYCQLDLIGKLRTVVWTELYQTANAGANQIKLTTAVDWVVGERIVIASTSESAAESEDRTITVVDPTKKIITLDKALVYTHKSTTQTFGTYSTTLRAEVGLLTRNIKIQGDSTSSKIYYGGHVMMYGSSEKGLISRIYHVQFSNCGQTATSKSCISYDRNGDLSDSFIEGNSIHNSYARAIALRESSYLYIINNVGYNTIGSSIYLETGTEKYNTIEYNLMISTLRTNFLEQNDFYPSSFYISHPLNDVNNNRAAGSDGNGFYFNFGYPTIPFRIWDIQMPESSNNIAHSNENAGLKINKASFAVLQGSEEEEGGEEPAPESYLQSLFDNYIIWNNKEQGVHVKDSDNILLNHFIIINFRQIGIYIQRTDTDCNYLIAIYNSIIASEVSYTFTSFSGVLLDGGPNSLVNTTFVNFPAMSTIIEIPTPFSLKSNVHYLHQVSAVNATGEIIYSSFHNPPTFIVLDSSLSTEFNTVARDGYTLVNAAPYNSHVTQCTLPIKGENWLNLTACSADVAITPVIIISGQPKFKITSIVDYFGVVSATQTVSTIQGEPLASDPGIHLSHVNLVGGQIYSIWNPDSNGFQIFTIQTGCVSPPNGDAAILRYNFTGHLNTVTSFVDGEQKIPEYLPLDKATCQFGDIYLTSRYLYVCVSSRGWKAELAIAIEPVPCVTNCDFPIDFNSDVDIVCPNSVTPVYWSNSSIWRRERPPVAWENVTIPANCKVILDVDVQNLTNLIIEGTLTIKDLDTVLSAKFIWVKGQLHAGTLAQPFQNNLMIRLLGNVTDPRYVVDSRIVWGKSLVVTGKLELYGKSPTTTQTRLTAVAAQGDTTLKVGSTAGWAVGQTIGISPSFSKFYEYEKRTITALTATTVTFATGLRFMHYGAVQPITKTQGDIDLRCVVGLLDRNIKIGTDSNLQDWSYSVLVYGWNSTNGVHSGSATISGVQFLNGGQVDSQRAALNIINTEIGTTNTLITNSVFESCLNYCVYLENVKFAVIQNNFLFEGVKYLVYVEEASSYHFKNNVMVGARNRSRGSLVYNSDVISCFHQNSVSTNMSITNNVCQGSQVSGFILPFVACDNLVQSDGYSNNTAGTAKIGFVFSDAGVTNDCKAAGYFKAYGCEIGVASNPTAAKVVWKGLMLADNERGIGLRFGVKVKNSLRNDLLLSDSWISAISRPQCPQCYADGKTVCSSVSALRLLVVTLNGDEKGFFNDSIQLIITPEQLDANAWISNVNFENFKYNYSSLGPNAIGIKCGYNKLFEVHPQSYSSIGNHHFTSTTCTGCETDAYGRLDPPLMGFGPAHGCGKFYCTGRNNYLIQDHDGSLLGFPGVIFPNNTLLQSEENCTWSWNVYGSTCKRTDIGRLKFWNIGKDFNTRDVSPVYLINQNTSSNIKINAWKEYEWRGTEPLNKRQGRFLSLIQFGQCYNVSFTGQPPSDMLFSLSPTNLEGDNSKWVCIKIYYPVINSIAVTFLNGTSAKSILSTSTDNVDNFTQTCGAHKFLYKENITHVLLTAASNCVVRLSLKSSVQATIRLNQEMSTFLASDGEAQFLQLLSTFLNIVKSRIKINGVYSGSTVVDFSVSSAIPAVEDSQSADPASPEAVEDLKNLSARISSASSSDIPNLMSVSTVTTITDGSGNTVVVSEETRTESKAKYIIIGCVIGGVGLIGAIALTYFLLKRFRGTAETNPVIDEPSVHKLDVLNNGNADNSVNLELTEKKENEIAHP